MPYHNYLLCRHYHSTVYNELTRAVSEWASGISSSNTPSACFDRLDN